MHLYSIQFNSAMMYSNAMDRAKLNYWIDILILLSFIIVAATGIIKWPGIFSHRDIPMRFLSDLHDWSGLAMSVLALVHVILHWRFLVVMTKSYLRPKKAQNHKHL